MIDSDENELANKVSQWVNDEGYPLEYFAANVFRRKGFRTTQGDYARDNDDTPREIDICADMTCRTDASSGLIRAYNIVECKWTKSKPWVVFTSPTTTMMQSAVAAQTISSEIGQAAMWAKAGDSDLTGLPLFSSPECGGFNGRQALSKGQDKFYDSIRSVVSATNAIAHGYNRYLKTDNMPRACVVAFPVIVIDGHLFAASYSADSDDIQLEIKDQIRCHWRGSAHSPFLTTIDIVTKKGLADFVDQRAKDFGVLLPKLASAYGELQECYRKQDPRLIKVEPGARGVIGWPPFLRSLLPPKAGEEKE
jgi:hypothetical protein